MYLLLGVGAAYSFLARHTSLVVVTLTIQILAARPGASAALVAAEGLVAVAEQDASFSNNIPLEIRGIVNVRIN